MIRTKRSIQTCLILCLSMVLAGAASAQDSVVLAKDGNALAKIYVSGGVEIDELTVAQIRKLPPQEQIDRAQAGARIQAVADLQHHLKAMTGSEFEVVVTDDPSAVKAPAIVLGALAVKMGAKPEHETKTGDAFRLIVRAPGHVLMGGESEVGASHAMYRLLRELGCRWIMPGPNGEVIPEHPTLSVEAMDLDVAPVFEVRAPWYSGGPRIVTAEEMAQFEQWKRRMGQTHGRADHPDFMVGGHMWAALLAWYKKDFEADPSMRAQVRAADGGFEPSKYQLEPTHPGVIDLTVRYIRAQFERNQWPHDKHVAMSIGPNDGAGYSESPETHAVSSGRIDPVTGGADETDALILYANKVMEQVADEFPNLKLGFYIYSVHADYPMRYEPNPRFVGHFADITYSRYHTINDPQSFTRAYYRNVLEQWAELSRQHGIPLWYYGYNWNLAENMFPYTRARHFGEEIPYYKSIGVLGQNNEQDKAWSILGPHNYILARLSWDTSLDWKELLREYCDTAFGAGGDAMYRYYILLDKTQTHAGVESGAYPAVPLVLDRDFLKEAKALLSEAAAAADTDFHRRNVEWFGQSVGALEIYHGLRDSLAKGEFGEAKKLYDNLMAHWQKQLDADSNLVSRYAFRYLDAWCLKPFLEVAAKHSSGEYSVVHQLPEELPTRFDPTDTGQLMGFEHPAQASDKFRKTHTYLSTWDAQGLGEYREGGVWYYDRFDLDAPKDGQGVGLLIGAVEDTVHVWLNGQYIGMGRGYFRPFLFDLTDAVNPDGEDVLALQIIRRNPINELGLGGMIQTSFVFTGPRLEQKAPAQEPMQRVLPGGSRE